MNELLTASELRQALATGEVNPVKLKSTIVQFFRIGMDVASHCLSQDNKVLREIGSQHNMQLQATFHQFRDENTGFLSEENIRQWHKQSDLSDEEIDAASGLIHFLCDLTRDVLMIADKEGHRHAYGELLVELFYDLEGLETEGFDEYLTDTLNELNIDRG